MICGGFFENFSWYSTSVTLMKRHSRSLERSFFLQTRQMQKVHFTWLGKSHWCSLAAGPSSVNGPWPRAGKPWNEIMRLARKPRYIIFVLWSDQLLFVLTPPRKYNSWSYTYVSELLTSELGIAWYCMVGTYCRGLLSIRGKQMFWLTSCCFPILTCLMSGNTSECHFIWLCSISINLYITGKIAFYPDIILYLGRLWCKVSWILIVQKHLFHVDRLKISFLRDLFANTSVLNIHWELGFLFQSSGCLVYKSP